MSKPKIFIVSPALATANNGNWRTAHRWRRFLQHRYQVELAQTWHNDPVDGMIALHARRSAGAVAAFSERHPGTPLVLVLTGTDLYRDIQNDAEAQRSLELASHLVVLQAAGLQELPPQWHAKTCVIHQSAPSLKPPQRKSAAQAFKVAMIGHLRDEKDPATFMEAAALLRASKARLIHVGGATEPHWKQQALATQARHSNYRWMGNLPYGQTRQLLKHGQLLVITSKMEGGANVIVEAVTSGVPVIASDISGNRGMLGDDYAGYFPVGDHRALAQLIDRAASDQDFYGQLTRQCAARSPLFSPAREQMALLQLMDNAMNSNRMSYEHIEQHEN